MAQDIKIYYFDNFLAFIFLEYALAHYVISTKQQHWVVKRPKRFTLGGFKPPIFRSGGRRDHHIVTYFFQGGRHR
jgi:hypothetical protein